ncbi:hypothetical protein LSTR_LSTR003103 [Laodelphax striatellus]|uniref:Uncharacterized protein n=1 Tax=Laodelphax striatellus TaxID=195883 RepID=A0A482WWL6_LAOST|nr:hypothetical protein LSTR_LSTR003103 [Laodelphax striatellus]
MHTSKLALVLSSLLAVTLAQQQQSTSSDNKQVRLEDIERDTLTNAQQRQQQQQQSQQQPTQQYGTLAQQQLAAYQQQQYLLQQLQQQQPYFPQALGAYPNPYSALPLMILPGNQLGVGPVGPAPGIPLQYFLPDASFLYQQPAPAGANPAAAFAASPLLASSPIYQLPPAQAIQARYRPVAASNAVQYRSNHQSQQSAQSQPQTSTYQQTAYQQQPTYQQSAIASSAATSQQVYQPQSQYYQQSQPSYNAYNSLYNLQQQRPQKNLFSSGVKSTVSPPAALKSSQSLSSINAYSQPLNGNDQASSYINYKTF